MPFYHIYIGDQDKQGERRHTMVYDLPEERVKNVASNLKRNKTFTLGGTFFRPSYIDHVTVFYSEQSFEELVFPDGVPPLDHQNQEIASLFLRKKVKGVHTCTGRYISSSPEEEEKITKASDSMDEKGEVFIGHGRDMKEALELQKYLRDDLKVDAKMFEDMKKESGCKTIIELLDYFKKNVSYAFIIFTPDDYGCLCEEMDRLTDELYRDKKKSRTDTLNEICETLKKRPRQNVVFELGLFIGAIERDKVCYLLQKDITDPPSNMDGVLHEPFEKSISETFVAITEKLRKSHLIKA